MSRYLFGLSTASLFWPFWLPSVSLAESALPEIPGEEYYFEDLPIILSATRLAQPQSKTPAAVNVIDRAIIDAMGVLNIPDLLCIIPGFQVAYSSGNTPLVTYHGQSDRYSRRMQVLIDGRPVYGPIRGGVSWNDIPVDIEDIKRIEVVRGPNAAAYGANAFLGAINITTNHSAEEQEWKVSLTQGNKDTDKALVSFGGRLNDWNMRGTLSYRNDLGFRSYRENNQEQERYDSKRVSLVNIRSDYIAPNNDNWEFQLGYADGTLGKGGLYGIGDEARDRQVRSQFQMIRWRRIRNNDSEHSLMLYHTYQKNAEYIEIGLASSALSTLTGTTVTPAMIPAFFGGHPDEYLITNASMSEERLELEYQHNYRVTESTRSVWGMSARLDRIGGDSWFNRRDRIATRLHRLFGHIEYQPTRQLTFNLGGMLEHSSIVGTHFSPRLAGNYQFTDTNGIRLVASRALRIPSAFEEYIDGAYRFADGTLISQYVMSQGNLQPESIRSYELGIYGHYPRHSLNWDLKIFHEHITDNIQTVDNYPYPQDKINGVTALIINSGTIQTNGAELSVTFRPRRYDMLQLSHAYSRSKGIAQRSFSPAFTDLGRGTPTHTTSLFAMHRFANHWDASLTYSRTSPMKWWDIGDSLKTQDRLDLRLAKTFLTEDFHSTVAITALNVLDEYNEFMLRNTFDTQVLLSLKISPR